MRTYILCLMMISGIFSSLSAQSITQRIDALFDDSFLEQADASVMVYDLTDNKLLYDHRGEKLCRPASVQKLITTITALDRLGTDYTLDTELRITGTIGTDSILHGDLYVVGGFDSEFTSLDMDALLAAIPAAGIRSIEGGLYADISMADTTYWGKGWCWDDAPASFQPYYSPLMVNKGCVDVRVSPGETGKPATVVCMPLSSYYEIENNTVSHGHNKGPLTITRDWEHQSNRIIVSGDVNSTQGCKLSVFTSDRHFWALFTERFLRKGLGFHHSGYAIAPDSSRCIAAVSRPIQDVAHEALKESDNLSAEAMFHHLSARHRRHYPTAAEGCHEVASFVRESLGEQISYRIVDGCGLSNYNLVNAHLLLSYLRYAYAHPEIYKVVSQSLPHCGIDGTLRGRLGTKAMCGRVVAKTGAISGVCTLAGYAKAVNGHQMAFVILTQQVIKMRQARAWQDKVCRAICGVEEP